MKILLVRTIAIEEDCSISTYNNQGIGLATELSKLGHECGLVYYAKKGKGFKEIIERDGVKLTVYHIEGKNLVWNAIYNKELYDICNQYDIIQTSECDQICSWLLYKKYPQKTIIYHGPYKSKYTKKYNLRSKVFDFIFLHRAKFIEAPVITKSYLAEKYLRKKGFKNVTTLGVGLNPYNLEQKIEEIPNKIKNVIDNKKNDKYILYIGAISKRKNLKFVLKILNKIVNEKCHKDYKLVVIGSKAYKEEKYYEECFNYIKRNNLDNNVINLKTVEQKYLKYVYNCSDVYVLPTQYDIFGMVYLEAMYFGTPIVTTLCGGSSLLIEEGKTGFIRKIVEPEEWADIIIKIAENVEVKENISRETKKQINEQYLWSVLVKKFEKEYKKLMNSKGSL